VTARPEKSNIVFVSLFGLTELYWEIARRLTADGYRVCWMTTNEYWTAFLVSQGVPRDDILQLIYAPSDFVTGAERETLCDALTRCEKQSSLSVNQALLMDRFITDRPRPDINEYILLYYRDIRRFLEANKTRWVFAEPTNANDLITYMVCRELGLAYVSPRDMRYPPRCLLFFDGYRQERLIPRKDGKTAVDGREVIERFAAGQSTPYYFEKLSRLPAIHAGKIVRSVVRRLKTRNLVSGRSLTHYDAWGRVKLAMRRSISSFYLRRLCRYDDIERLDGKLVYYGLHVQPENSIDVFGSYVSDQLKLIKDIRRALPFDATLIVKEHPNFLGMKSIRFFCEVKKIPNVKLVRHDLSSFDIYRRVSLVVTVSGTIAYEAGLLGIPAVTFSPMYFGGLSSVFYRESPSALQNLAPGLLNGFERDYKADCDFMSTLIGNSHDAYWTDPLFDRTVLNPENITRLADAFRELLSHDYD
jgi:hypothetical protein